LWVLAFFTFTAGGHRWRRVPDAQPRHLTGALFMLAGMIYERKHTYELRRFGGLATPMPVYATFFLVAVLSSVGLPLLNGFIGEFLVLSGRRRAIHMAWCTPRWLPPGSSGAPLISCGCTRGFSTAIAARR